MVRKIFFTAAIGLPLLIGFAATESLHALWALLVVGPLIVGGLHDITQSSHSLLRIYPDAQLVGAPGLVQKRSDLRFAGELGTEPPEGWGGVFEQMRTVGVPKLNEVVFFHLPSRTLILTDFAFNQGEASGLPAVSRVFLTMAKAYGPLGPSRFFRFLTEDREAVKQCVAGMLDRWPVEHVTMSHGEPVSDAAADRLRAAYADW